MKAYRFRIYPTKVQEKQLSQHLFLAKNLWNELLEHTQQTYIDYGYFPTRNTLAVMTKESGLYSQASQEIASRLLDSVWRFIKLRKEGNEDVGFPRFKSINRMKSLHYPQSGFSLGTKLKVTPFGNLCIVKHREMKGDIKTLTLKREASGKWFAIFCVELGKDEPLQPKENRGEEVGIDLGLKNFAVLSNGEVIRNPRHIRKYQDKHARFARLRSRKVKRSHNWKKANLKVARIDEKVANSRSDFLNKTSTRLVNSYSLIALEKLASQELAEKNYGKSINDVGWGTFANMISYKAEEAGCRVVFVDPNNTTQECSGCHKLVHKELQDRIHNCPNCSLVMDRDLNAAINILARARTGTGIVSDNVTLNKRATVGITGSNACEDETKNSSVKQEATTWASAKSW